MARPRQYTREFKLKAVRRANEPDQSCRHVTRNLGVSDSTLHRWDNELGTQGPVPFPGQRKAGSIIEQAEIKRLQCKLDIGWQELRLNVINV